MTKPDTDETESKAAAALSAAMAASSVPRRLRCLLTPCISALVAASSPHTHQATGSRATTTASPAALQSPEQASTGALPGRTQESARCAVLDWLGTIGP